MGKHSTYRGIEIGHYKMMRSSMDKEAFGKWVQTVTGRPRGRKQDPLIKAYENSKPIDWETLAKKLQAALSAQIKETQEVEEALSHYREQCYKLRNQSWLSRLFNLKG